MGSELVADVWLLNKQTNRELNREFEDHATSSNFPHNLKQTYYILISSSYTYTISYLLSHLFCRLKFESTDVYDFIKQTA